MIEKQGEKRREKIADTIAWQIFHAREKRRYRGFVTERPEEKLFLGEAKKFTLTV